MAFGHGQVTISHWKKRHEDSGFAVLPSVHNKGGKVMNPWSEHLEKSSVLGHDQNRNCSLVPPPPSESVVPPSMLCKYVGGTGGRVLQVDYKCMPGAPMNLKAESTGVSAMAVLCRQRLFAARR